ncbi:RrF2 family transcriptional regulator [Rhodococcus sp. NPDC003318]|uniref:RrF2 family transcriptional regulator n=1 Tax=Rhodococcus sp. NPDC003318 TaxID=3364503 RepID=UPI0036BF0B1C
MKLSGGIEWAVHCCVVLSGVDAPVPAARLAELHEVSGTYLAKQMQNLSRAGLVRSVQGKAGGYVLTRPPEQITMLDVVEAIEGTEPSFVCTEIRQRGPFAVPPEKCTRTCPIARAMYAADDAWRASLREITIADLVADVNSPTDVLSPVRAWLSGPAVEPAR